MYSRYIYIYIETCSSHVSHLLQCTECTSTWPPADACLHLPFDLSAFPRVCRKVLHPEKKTEVTLHKWTSAIKSFLMFRCFCIPSLDWMRLKICSPCSDATARAGTSFGQLQTAAAQAAVAAPGKVHANLSASRRQSVRMIRFFSHNEPHDHHSHPRDTEHIHPLRNTVFVKRSMLFFRRWQLRAVTVNGVKSLHEGKVRIHENGVPEYRMFFLILCSAQSLWMVQNTVIERRPPALGDR